MQTAKASGPNEKDLALADDETCSLVPEGALKVSAAIRTSHQRKWSCIHAGFPNGENDNDDRLGLDRRAPASQGYEDCIHAGL